MVKIKKLKRIHVQKNIKMGQFVENLHCQKVVGPQEVNFKIMGYRLCIK